MTATPSGPLRLTRAQEAGVRWMLEREAPDAACGGVLADEAGSGKSAVICGLLRAAPRWPTLILAPSSMLHTWEDVLRAWVPDAAAEVLPAYRSASAANEDLARRLAAGRVRVVIAPHSCLNRQAAALPLPLRECAWARVVLDEAHVAKNPKTLTHRAVCSLRAASRWAVTATPVQNTRDDLLALAKCAGIRCTDPAEVRRDHVLCRVAQAQAQPEAEAQAQPEAEAEAAQTPDAGPDAKPPPEATEACCAPGAISVHTVLIPMRHEAERALYEETRAEALAASSGASSGASRALCLEGLLRCGQACTHAAVLYGSLARCERYARTHAEADVRRAAARAAAALAAPEDAAFAGSKLAWLCDDLCEQAALGEDVRALVFCDWRAEMEVLQAMLERRAAAEGGPAHLRARQFHGDLDLQDRDAVLASFTRAARPGRPAARVLLMQTRCGGCGLNLQAATRVYFVRPHVNPAAEYQAIARAYRRGQRAAVTVLRLVAEGTVDEAILARQADKRAMIRGLLGGGGACLEACARAAVLRPGPRPPPARDEPGN